jgi:hypothetical protein
MTTYLRGAAAVLVLMTGVGMAAAQGVPNSKTDPVILDQPKPEAPTGTIAPASQIALTQQQKTEIFNAVTHAGKPAAPVSVPTTPGEQVPPAIELYVLPDNALAIAPEAKGMKYTLVQNQVVLVDPTTMRVVDVIKQ